MLFALPFGIANNYVARSAVTQCERVSCNLLSHAAVAAAAVGVFFCANVFVAQTCIITTNQKKK